MAVECTEFNWQGHARVVIQHGVAMTTLPLQSFLVLSQFGLEDPRLRPLILQGGGACCHGRVLLTSLRQLHLKAAHVVLNHPDARMRSLHVTMAYKMSVKFLGMILYCSILKGNIMKIIIFAFVYILNHNTTNLRGHSLKLSKSQCNKLCRFFSQRVIDVWNSVWIYGICTVYFHH